MAGRQGGLKDERSGLIREVFRIYDAMPCVSLTQCRLSFLHLMCVSIIMQPPMFLEACHVFGECCRAAFAAVWLQGFDEFRREGTQCFVLFCVILVSFVWQEAKKEGTESFLGVTAVGACWTFSLGLGVL